MKVYVVRHKSVYGEIHGIFSSKEKAEEYVSSYHYPFDVELVDYALDEVDE